MCEKEGEGGRRKLNAGSQSWDNNTVPRMGHSRDQSGMSLAECPGAEQSEDQFSLVVSLHVGGTFALLGLGHLICSQSRSILGA